MATQPAAMGFGSTVFSSPGRRERRGRRGEHRGEAPLARAKTDRLDGAQLLTMLLRHTAGAKKVWVWYGSPAGSMKTAASCPGNSCPRSATGPAGQSDQRAAGWLWPAHGVARGGGDPARAGPPGGWRAAAHGLARSPEAGVAEGSGSYGAEREPGDRAASRGAHQCRAGRWSRAASGPRCRGIGVK